MHQCGFKAFSRTTGAQGAQRPRNLESLIEDEKGDQFLIDLLSRGFFALGRLK